MQKGLELCEKVQPDLLLATDPDSDRVGIAVNQGGEFKLMTGNEVGILLLDFIARVKQEQGKLPAHPVAVTTIVSTDMVDPIAQHYGVEMRRCLTGFKYIGDIIADVEQKRAAMRASCWALRESYGYLSGGYVRDKDAVDGSMLICEMASYYKRQGKTLVDAMNALYETYGYYKNATLNFGFEGEDGMKTMQKIMDTLRSDPPAEIAGTKVIGRSDYEALPVLWGTRRASSTCPNPTCWGGGGGGGGEYRLCLQHWEEPSCARTVSPLPLRNPGWGRSFSSRNQRFKGQRAAAGAAGTSLRIL